MRGVILAVVVCWVSSAHGDTQTSLNTLDALSASRHNNLVALIKLANLTDLFTDPNNTYTIFAPSERNMQSDLRHLGLTFDDLKNDPALLKDVLSYHVLPGVHQRKEFFNERLFTTASGEVLRTNHYVINNRYYVDGSLVSNTAIQTSNGIIHNVAHLLYPIKGNIYELIAQDKNLTTLKTAIDAAGLMSFLEDQAPITIFAPTDNAFAQLGNAIQGLLAQPEMLKEVLAYHVIPGSLYHSVMHDTTLHTFEEADRITLDSSRFGVNVDSARLRDYDISATNGVIHKISQVLVPASLKDKLGL